MGELAIDEENASRNGWNGRSTGDTGVVSVKSCQEEAESGGLDALRQGCETSKMSGRQKLHLTNTNANYRQTHGRPVRRLRAP